MISSMSRTVYASFIEPNHLKKEILTFIILSQSLVLIV